MKGNKKKSKIFMADQIETDVETTLNDLADAVSEDARLKCASDRDPYELYIHHTASKIYANAQLFRSRLIKGYQALLDEIGHLEDSQSI